MTLDLPEVRCGQAIKDDILAEISAMSGKGNQNRDHKLSGKYRRTEMVNRNLQEHVRRRLNR